MSDACDTNIIGSQVNGKQITADVGGDLNIASVQDMTTSAAHQSSAGGGFTISQYGGGGASFSAQNGHGDANYAGVNEQAGLYAGDGGFNVSVKGKTDLKGAVIASDATADKNSLTTGTLSFSDIQNESHYSAASNGVSAGIAVGLSGKTVGPASGTNGGGISPMLPQDANGDEHATTRSAVAAGTIDITNGANQTQDVASLSRDTTNTNGTVSKTPDVNALLDKQADMMNAAQAAGQAVAQRIGDYADQQAKATGDPEWREGGDKRAAMQAAGAAVVAGLGGGVGSAVAGAAGAAVGSKMGGELNKLSDSIAASNPTGNADIDKTLGNIVANVVATGAGAVVGGGAGAFSSYDVDRYNRQLHPDERQWAEKSAMDFAAVYKEKTGQDLTPDQAQNMLLANGYRLVDAAASKGPGGDAVAVAYISKNAGNLFSATSAEYNSPFLYGNKNGSLTPEQLALPGSTATPATGLAIAGGLVTAGLGPEIVSGAATAVSYGKDLLAAYKTAQAGYSLTTAAATGATASGTLYTGGAAAGAYMDYRKNGADFIDSFDQRFSYAGLATAATFGAYSTMFSTSMFNWAGIPNSIQNATTIPGIVIRGTNLAIGQTAGKAAQAAVKSGESKKN